MFCFLTWLLKLKNPFDTDRGMLIKPIYRVGRAAKLAKPTIRLIRDGEKGCGGGERGRLYDCRYTVTTRMTPALRWAEMRAI